MGATVSAGLQTGVEKATPKELQEAAAKLSPDDLAKVKAALAAVSPAWKIESAPDGGVLLCGHPGSGNVVCLMLFCLKHMKDKYKFQMCDIMKGEQNSADFLAMNPFHQVPSAKMSDGTNLYESSAALRYLATKFAPETYPADKQLLIDMALDKRQSDLYKAWGVIGYYAMQISPSKPEKDAAKKLNQVLANMATAFLGGKYIGGDTLCIADYSILPLINTLSLPTTQKVGYKLPERWAKYLADAKADLGDIFTEAGAVHEGWVGSNESKVETIEFDADEAVPGPSGDWKMEAAPDGGILLCGHPGSGNVMTVMLFGLKHMKDKYKFQMCDIMQGHQMGADFLAMNPFHQVPSGKMADGTALYESSAMLRYMARNFAPETYPADKQLLIDMALDKRQTDLYKAWGAIGYYAMQVNPTKPEADAAKKLNSVLGTMELAFLKGKYIGGDILCIADYSLLPLINTLSLPVTKKVGYTLPDRWAKYLADAKADLGEVFTEAGAVHEGWVASNESKVETIAFD
jgi:glutathione S-transferase